MKVYVITECRLDASGNIKMLPYVRMVSRSFEKAYGWFSATRDSEIDLNQLLDLGSAYGDNVARYTHDGEWFSFKTNYGGVYEETIVTFNEVETR